MSESGLLPTTHEEIVLFSNSRESEQIRAAPPTPIEPSDGCSPS